MQQGRSNVYIDVLLPQVGDSNKQCFHSIYAYLSAARNNISSCCLREHILLYVTIG